MSTPIMHRIPEIAEGINPSQNLRDKVAYCVFEQIIKDNGFGDIANMSEVMTDNVSKCIAKISYKFADDFLRERYESQRITVKDIK